MSLELLTPFTKVDLQEENARVRRAIGLFGEVSILYTSHI